MDKFIKDLEKLLAYLNEIQKEGIAYIGVAEKLVKELGLGEDVLKKVTKEGVRKNLSICLEKVKEDEDAEVYIQAVGELVREHSLDEAEVRKGLDEAVREAELRRFGYYVNMIQNGNIYLISKAKEMQKKYGIKSPGLGEAIRQGEYAYLVDNIRQIRRGSPFYLEEETLRNLAKRHGCETELEEAIRERGRKNDRNFRDSK